MHGTGVTLDVDALTGDPGVGQAVQDGRVHVLRQLDQGVVDGDGDAAEVLAGQATLVGQGADDGTRADVLTLAHREAVGGEVAVTVGTRGTLTALAALLEAAAAAVAATVLALEAVGALAAALRREILHEEVGAGLGLCGQGCGDILQRDVLLVGVTLDQLAERIQLLGFERLGDGVGELLLAGLVDVVDGGQLHLGQRRVGGALDGPEHTALARGDEEDRLAAAARAAGAADAVDVGLGVVRDVEVQHVADAVDVQAAGGDIGGDQDVQLAVLELIDGALALVLRDVAVDGGRGETAGAQLLGDLLGLVLGAHEDDHGLELGDLEDAGDRVQLVAVRDVDVALRDVGGGTGLGLDRDLARLVEVLLGDLADAVGHRRGEQRDLLVVRGVLEDALDILLEAHVEHLVGLIEDEEAQLGDVQGALGQVVDDSTRGAHDDLGAAAQARELNAVGLAAVDRQHLDPAEVIGEGLEGVGHLERELAGGGQHERLGGALLGVDAGEDRQRERGRLAGAGLREADDVVALHQDRDGLRLDRGGGFVTHLLHRGEDGVRQAQVVEPVALGLIL